MFPLLALMMAVSFQSTTALDTAVATFTGQPIGAEGGARTAIDTRLKLASCPAPSLAWQSDLQTAVVIRCPAPAWRIYVPVQRTAVSRPAAAVRAAPAARPEPVVRRGDLVSIEASAPGFSVTREGVALGDAAPGERLQVRVADGKPPVQAVAVEAGRVSLPAFAE